jgi:hypothetical protein
MSIVSFVGDANIRVLTHTATDGMLFMHRSANIERL